MTTIHLKKSLIALTLLSASIAHAADTPAMYQGDEESRANCEKMSQQVLQNRQARIEALIPKPANEAFSTGTCLDSLMNTRFNIFTIGSLDSILDRLMNAAKNKACGAVMGAWNQTINQANAALGTSLSVPYLGTIVSTNVGSGVGSPININNGNGVNLGTSNAAATVTNTYNSATSAGTAVVNTVKQAATTTTNPTSKPASSVFGNLFK